MSVFDGLVGQNRVRNQLFNAAQAARALVSGGVDSNSAMAHAWLFTGPPGSGRSVAARMFAAALQCTGETVGCGQCHGCKTVMEGNHPDVERVTTDGVVITIDRARELVGIAHTMPGAGSWRIMIVEDADRMVERTTNVLLKAIEEPPAFTIWILCTPSRDDVLPTIRSRCRDVQLAIPSVQEVANLLISEGIDPQRAFAAAAASQSHVGRARGLATDPEAALEREFLMRQVIGIRSAGDAVLAAHRIVNYYPGALNEPPEASKTRKSRKSEIPPQLQAIFDKEEANLRRELGIEPDSVRIRPAFQAQIRHLKENQKRRATRHKRDRVDRVLVDLMSLYRDVLTIQLGAAVPLVNIDFEREIREISEATTPDQSIRRMDALAAARERLAGNVQASLAVAAAMMALRPRS